jgi:hypothetical protein
LHLKQNKNLSLQLHKKKGCPVVDSPFCIFPLNNQRLSREGTVAHDQTRDIMAIIMGITIITIQIYFSSIPNSVLGMCE